MAPLYKRYIPPKTSTVAEAAPVELIPKPAPPPTPDETQKKRKRERTDEEIVERKANKLRKKGIDPTTVANLTSKESGRPASADAINGNSNVAISNGTHTSEGEFAHVKNTKKRHKFEKAARKARKVEAASQNGAEGVEESSRANGAQVGENRDAGQQGVFDDTRTQSLEDIPRARSANGNSSTFPAGSELDLDEWSTEAVTDKKRSKTRGNDAVSKDMSEKLQKSCHPENQQDGDTSQPKKRRHKLESILKSSKGESTDVRNDDDEHLRKHEGVMHKFQKSKAISQTAPKPSQDALERAPEAEPVILDLGPLPQPEKAPTPEFVPDPYALPEWLSKPNVVSSDNKKSFKDLKLEPKLVEQLSKLGFKESMPVQEVLIPLLLPPGAAGARFLPGTESILPDVAVGASTGSGKTIAYLLPLIESLKRTADLGRLKALVVVPTRELVVQVAAVADSLARGSSIKIGMATGTGNFKDEQIRLVKTGRKYDPTQHHKLVARAHQRNYPPAPDTDEFAEYLNDIENQDVRGMKRIEDTVSCLVDHVPTYESAVDILIATPGRLLEHLGFTLGFNLAHLEWLILDEADKLIEQQYHGFLHAINSELERPHEEEEQDAREQYLRSSGSWNEHRERRVRKVMLSATMTRDISKLVDLRLKRPQLVVVRGQDASSDDAANAPEDSIRREQEAIRAQDDGFEIPPTLREYCAHVGDGSEKPLYLTELLSKQVLTRSEAFDQQRKRSDHDDISETFDAERSSSDSISSEDDRSDSGLASDHELSPEEHAETTLNHRDRPSQDNMDVELAMHPERTAMLEGISTSLNFNATAPTVLVFTASTEAANRLSHLLKKLLPDLAFAVHTMTSADQKKNPFSTVEAADPVIIVSTDRAGRGLDTIAGRPVTHVLQYDVPRSTTAYVHRVGRTARAGRLGEAWTLYTHSEARWVLNEVAKVKTIKRVQPVEKIKLPVVDEASREALQNAIAEMRDEVYRLGKRSAQW